MRDFIPPIPFLAKAVTPFAEYIGATTLPLHIHEVVISYIAYTLINKKIAPAVSTWLFPQKYPALSAEKKFNWNVHVVSLCQSILVNSTALYVILTDEERSNMTWQERVWGYTGASGMIQGLATGYFLWDLVITIQNVKMFGPGMLAHAVSALTVFSFGFRPFVNYYASTFILYELSSPFLNFHWFFDKLNLTGSRRQLVNGILLLSTFFGCRLCWGTYQSLRVYQDMWMALHHTPGATYGKAESPIHDELMKYTDEEFLPLWLAVTYLGSNLVLNALNFYWFAKMIDALRKRFVPAKASGEKPKLAMTGSNGRVKIETDETTVRRRNVALSELDIVPIP
ncbi:hypothetical protein V502_09164 [Pseudogymnoascus sp. VKM F-4520 (FW-2644)]|nr:hypothetical protein V502_09164 [Pseudogymnoascus sp. VKM F-4520 (FW-2644)]